MRVARVLFVTMLVTAPALAQMPASREALDGVDPVALLTQGKEISGKPEFKVSHGKFDYLFANAENKAIFEKTPGKYEVQLNGACARMGGGVTGNASDYAVVDGKIYIFGSDDCHKKFVAAPAKYLPRAAPPMPTAAADLQKGRAMIDRAVAAIGGAERLDAIASYVETSSQVQKRAAGDVTVATKTIRRFPSDVRVERTMTMGDRTQQSATLVTKEGAWFIGQGRAYPQNAEGRATSEQEYGRHLVSILRARRDAGFKVAALPPATVDGATVDRVRVQHRGVDVTLNLDPASARVSSVSFTARNMDGEIGDYTLLLSDVREVSGLRLPFAERALFNGAPDGFLTRDLTSIAINQPLDAALFQPPPPGEK